jgi:hypothetical protein
MMECSSTIALVYKVTTNLTQTQLKAISKFFDRMLVLLMGDDYDRSIPVDELLCFGYPNVTDEELQDMILDNW